jgi:hypothetical protein
MPGKAGKTIRGQFANATAVLLAASATTTRYVRSIHVTNNTGSVLTWNLAFAATATSAGPGIFGESIAANARTDRYYGGQGERLDNVAISGFASAATSVSFEINYDENVALDA